jgi:hypothetical protein
MVKDGYAAEVQARRDAEQSLVRLKSELSFYQQASIFNGHDFIHYSKLEIEDLNNVRADLELVCHDLKSERDSLVSELETHSKNIEKLFASQKPQDLHWERLQHAYQQQLNSMQKEMTLAKTNYAKLIKGREDIISDMILLNSKNAELTQLNNNLSRRVMEREQEAKAVFAGTSFLSTPEETTKGHSHSNSNSSTNSNPKHRRNLSTGSIGLTHSSSMSEIKDISSSTAKLAQRDSFNGSAAPKLFKFRRNKSGSGKHKITNKQEDKIISIPYDQSTRSLEPVSEALLFKKESENVNSRPGGKHHFAQTKFLRPIKCEACNEKMWRVSELKCSGKKLLHNIIDLKLIAI